MNMNSNNQVAAKMLAGGLYMVFLGLVALVIYFCVSLVLSLFDIYHVLLAIFGFLVLSYALGSYLFKKWNMES